MAIRKTTFLYIYLLAVLKLIIIYLDKIMDISFANRPTPTTRLSVSPTVGVLLVLPKAYSAASAMAMEPR